MREGKACAFDGVTKQLERHFEEKLVHIWTSCCLPVKGDERYFHVLVKHLSE